METPTGNNPHLGFRSVSDSHIRKQPFFVPLDPVQQTPVRTFAEARALRQHTRVWDALHLKRVTTSKIAATLGFYERDVATRLGVPKSLQGHGKAVAVWHHLVHDEENPLQTLIAATQAKLSTATATQAVPLVATVGLQPLDPDRVASLLKSVGSKEGRGATSDSDDEIASSSGAFAHASAAAAGKSKAKGTEQSASTDATQRLPLQSPGGLWRLTLPAASVVSNSSRSTQPPTFAYRYCPARPADTGPGGQSPFASPSDGSGGVRMQWGSIQESIGVLAALNALVGTQVMHAHRESKIEQACMLNSRVLECGLCPSECVPLPPDLPFPTDQLPLFGASPDGVIMYGDGRVEGIEVKSHSPFQEKVRGAPGPAFTFVDRGPQESVGPWYVPQLMMECFCLGPHCTGVNFVSVSASRGARVFWVPRDDRFISLMLLFVYRFKTMYADTGREPPANFFSADATHRELVRETLRIAKQAELRLDLPDTHVQRSPHNGHLFHDNRGAPVPFDAYHGHAGSPLAPLVPVPGVGKGCDSARASAREPAAQRTSAVSLIPVQVRQKVPVLSDAAPGQHPDTPHRGSPVISSAERQRSKEEPADKSAVHRSAGVHHAGSVQPKDEDSSDEERVASMLERLGVAPAVPHSTHNARAYHKQQSQHRAASDAPAVETERLSDTSSDDDDALALTAALPPATQAWPIKLQRGRKGGARGGKSKQKAGAVEGPLTASDFPSIRTSGRSESGSHIASDHGQTGMGQGREGRQAALKLTPSQVR